MHYFFSILFCITLYGGTCYCSDRPKTDTPAVEEKESLWIRYLRDGEVPAPPVFEGKQEEYDQDQWTRMDPTWQERERCFLYVQ